MDTCEIIELPLIISFFFCLEKQNKCFIMNFYKGIPTSLKVFL